MRTQAPASVVWHDVECGGYAADLPLWRELARAAGGSVLEVGAGTGRVALDLSRKGHAVTAVDSDAELLAALRERARGLPVETVVADAREFALGGRYSLCVVPMQTIQLLGGRRGRAAFLRRAHAHLTPGGILAAAVTGALEPFDGHDRVRTPLPDVREQDGWLYSSQPVAVRTERCVTVIERVREAVAPDGEREVSRDVVALDVVSAAEIAREALALGFEPLPARTIEQTDEHVGSEVVVLRA